MAGNEYVFQVSAENQVGVGEPAELSHGVVAKSPFGEYTNHEKGVRNAHNKQLYMNTILVQR